MTEYLARVVGKKGHVYALDISSEQINVTKDRILKAGLTNVTFIMGDITSVKNFSAPPADIVYCRLVLMHLKNPSLALNQMQKMLKPGGVLALQESIMETAHFSVDNEKLKNY